MAYRHFKKSFILGFHDQKFRIVLAGQFWLRVFNKMTVKSAETSHLGAERSVSEEAHTRDW